MDNQNIEYEDVRIRYGRTKNGTPKNTLVTFRDGDYVYFGVAKCRLGCDRPKKHEGRKLATLRAKVAFENSYEHQANYKTSREHGPFQLHQSGLFGWVHKNHIVKLLQWFESLS